MGIPLPGETGLLIAAAAAGTGTVFSIWWVIAAASAGAIVGDTLGYWIGRKGGRVLLLKITGNFFIKAEHLDKAENFFKKHGAAAVFFGRSVSYLRVLTALLAGFSSMHIRIFFCITPLAVLPGRFFSDMRVICSVKTWTPPAWDTGSGMAYSWFLLCDNLPLCDR